MLFDTLYYIKYILYKTNWYLVFLLMGSALMAHGIGCLYKLWIRVQWI